MKNVEIDVTLKAVCHENSYTCSTVAGKSEKLTLRATTPREIKTKAAQLVKAVHEAFKVEIDNVERQEEVDRMLAEAVKGSSA